MSLDADSLASTLAGRFRGYLPVVIDVETGGFNAQTDALLEIAAVIINIDDEGRLFRDQTVSCHLEPFAGANIEQAALDFTGIDLTNRSAATASEPDALTTLFTPVRKCIKMHGCTRAIVVGHNAHFDLAFLNAAVTRCNIKRNPFHPFSCFDTATLAGLDFGQTVLAKACQFAGIEFSNRQAHSAAYDAERTAELFCAIVNRWADLGGWPCDPDSDFPVKAVD